MLFDLRARGRRRTVQVVYLGLALLFAIGFIGFGVGGGFGGGGVLEGLFGKEGAARSGFTAQIDAAEKRVKRHPGEAEAWAKLADAKYRQAGGSEFLNEATGKFTEKGKALLGEVAAAWSRYMALNPSKPNTKVAQEILPIYGKEGLNQPAAAVQVLQQVIIPAKPSNAAYYGFLARYAYEAKNVRVGDLASKKAVTLAPANVRAQVKAQLEQIKANPTGNGETFTATSKSGQPYKVNLGKGGKGTAVPLPSKTTKKK